MKAAESKTTTTTQALQTKASEQQPFFQAQSEQQGAFFGQATPAAKPFFTPFIQTKLSIGQPGDKYEQEADAMAEQVVQKLSSGKTESSVQRKCADCAAQEQEEGIAPKLQLKSIFESNEEPAGGQLQRKCEACAVEKIQPMRIQRMSKEEEPELQAKGDVPGLQASADLESRLNSTKGGGSPLSDETRSSMESSFGTDFSGVRVHTNSGAVQMNQELGAQAFTHGSDVYFNSGKYDTGSREGNRLLGHELTHVVQQGGGIQRFSDPTPPLEFEDAQLEAVISGGGPISDNGDAVQSIEEGSGLNSKSESVSSEQNEFGVESDVQFKKDGSGTTSNLSRSTISSLRATEAIQLYSGSAGAAYARTWALTTNPSYPRMGNDCTNFVSQAMLAGGWPMLVGAGYCADRTKDSVWWYRRNGCTYLWRSNVHASHTWGGAENFYQFVRSSGRGTAAARVADLKIGDVLQIAFSGTHRGHSMIVTDKSNGNLFLSYHTSDHLDEPFWGTGGILDRYPSANYYGWLL